MSDDKVLAEQDNPHNLIILGAVVVTCVALVVMVLGVDQFYRFAVEDEVGTKQLQVTSPARRELKAVEQARLGKYQWVDQAKGVVRIPVADAKALTMRDWASRPDTMAAPAAPAVPAAPAAPRKGGK